MEVAGFVLLVVYVAIVYFRRLGRAAYRAERRKPRSIRSPANNWGMADANNQWQAVTSVAFRREKIMNSSEYRVFRALEDIVGALDNGYRVMAQTSLGELIRPDPKSADWKVRKDAFASINSKRVDFAIVDKFGYLALAVEYQGGGHESSTSAARDAVKQEALRRANVPLIEVQAGMTPSQLNELVANKLRAHQ